MSNEKTRLLDHGYVAPVEFWGSDEAVIAAARMSTGGGFVSWNPYNKHPKGDLGLLSFLFREGHSSAFEVCGATFEVQAPVMVFRQWHRHRTMSYSEASGRYGPLPSLDYLPSLDRLTKDSGGTNKQAGRADGAPPLSEKDAEIWLNALESFYERSEDLYRQGLAAGVPKELARLCLSSGRYSTMRVSANLLNWLRFLGKRTPPDAQEEIRLYAETVATLLREKFPRTMGLWDNRKPPKAAGE